MWAGHFSERSTIVLRLHHAAIVAFFETSSGAGAQMYAEKTGVGSRVSPWEMMMPIGSFDVFALESFFIRSVGRCAGRIARARYVKAGGIPYLTIHGSFC